MLSNSSPSKLVTRLLQGITVIVGVSIILSRAVFNNAPYEHGIQFVATDPRITAVTGANHKAELRLLRNFRFKESEQTGTAHMTIKSTAAKGEFDVELWLDKRNGQWTVTSADVAPVGGAVVYSIGK